LPFWIASAPHPPLHIAVHGCIEQLVRCDLVSFHLIFRSILGFVHSIALHIFSKDLAFGSFRKKFLHCFFRKKNLALGTYVLGGG
jgi:hypothetical protein